MDTSRFEQNSYSLQEITELTGFPRSRFDSAARRGQLEVVEDKYRARRAKHYTTESIIRFMKEFEERQNIDGVTVTKLAKEIGLHPNQIYNLLRQEGLETIKVGNRSKRTVLPPKTEAAIRSHFDKQAPKFVKSMYYSKPHDVLLFQPFSNSKQETYRVIKNGDQWGFNSPSGQFVEFNEFKLQYRVSPKYKIHKPTLAGLPYTEMKLPMNDHDTFEFYDLVVPLWGLENLRMQREAEQLIIQLRSSKLTITYKQYEQFLHLLPKFLKENYYRLDSETVELFPSFKKVSVEVPFEDYKEFLDYIEAEKGWTLKEGIHHAINLVLKERG